MYIYIEFNVQTDAYRENRNPTIHANLSNTLSYVNDNM